MKLLLPLFLCLMSCSAWSQKTEHITVKFDKSKQVKESYDVLQSDKLKKHGEYKKYFPATDYAYMEPESKVRERADLIKEKGNYINGKKNGEWITYVHPDVIASKGSYVNDKKVGIWETRINVEVVERFDYDANKKLTPYVNVVFPYPREDEKKSVEGTVLLRYSIKTDCTIDSIQVLKSLSPNCDLAAIEAIKKAQALIFKHGPGDPCEVKVEEKEVKFRLPE
ncbi:MAG: TonB family protein [Cytophagaceae bacterium]|jgi:TonB family protein|nr:TonB family protein [Cytophagaceae bacterium]